MGNTIIGGTIIGGGIGGGGTGAFGGSAIFAAQNAKTSGLRVYLFPPLASGEGILGWQLQAQERAGAMAAVDATKDLYTNAGQTQGIRVTHIGRPGVQGNGWGFFRGSSVGTIEIEEAQTTQNWLFNGAITGAYTAAQLKALIDAEANLSSVYFGGETGTSTPFATLTNDQIFGGLVQFSGGVNAIPAESISVNADISTSIVTVKVNTSDTLGDIADVVSAVSGLGVAYFGGADATTVAARPLPWTEIFDLATIVGGPQGRFPVYIYRNSQTQITTAPTGGSYVISTGILTAPAGWSIRRNTPSNTQVTYVATAYINPAISTNTLVPSWSIPVEHFDVSAVDERIAPYARITPSGTIAVPQIPDEVMLDAEFTASAVRTLLGLTAQQISDTFVGASLTNRVITYTQVDGTTIALTLPVDMIGQADGVVSSAVLNGNTLELTLSTGTTVSVDLAALRTMGSALAIQDEGTALSTATALNFEGTGVTAVESSGVVTVTIPGTHGTPIVTHENYLGVSDDIVFTVDEFTVNAMTNALVIPTYTGLMYVVHAKPAVQGDYTFVYLYAAGNRNTQNQISAYTQPSDQITLGGELHNILYSNDALSGASGLVMEAG